MPEMEKFKEFFTDMTWPADKDTLMEHARTKSADEETMNFLEDLPDDETFESWEDVHTMATKEA